MNWSSEWHAVLATDATSRRRLAQGRAWDRSGRVTKLRATPGALGGTVQGSAATPFAVEIGVEQFSDAQWERVLEVLGSQARHHAHLLAGQAPGGLVDQLADIGLRLMPDRGELDTDCGCGDSRWPCLHVAAVWEAAGARLDDDPFLLFSLRGRGRQQLLGDLADRRSRPRTGVPLEELSAHGWTTPADAHEVLLPSAERSAGAASLLRLLGDPPGWEGRVSAHSLFAPLVEQAAEDARRRLR